jgi:hypothetical protein
MIRLRDILFEQLSNINDPELLQVDPRGFTVYGNTKTGETTVDAGKLDGWPYNTPESSLTKRSNYYEAPGIDTSLLGLKINHFAKSFGDEFEKKFGFIVLPVITSGYRPPKRQIDAVWSNWVDNNNYLHKVGYQEPFKTVISDIFDRTNLEETNSNYLTHDQAKKQAVNFLKTQEKSNKYMSNHQTRGAIDIKVMNKQEYNNWISEFLKTAKQKGIIQSYIDERRQKNAHFHIRLRGEE